MLDFPNNPALDQMFEAGDYSWQWDGEKWVVSESTEDIDNALYPDGIFIDVRGTGTTDDTAIWNKAIVDAISLKLNKIYARKPSYIKNLTISQPIEIVGGPGFKFILAAGSGVSDGCVLITGNGVVLRNIEFSMTPWNWHGTDAIAPASGGTTPVGNFGVKIRPPNAQLPGTVMPKDILLDHLKIVGGGGTGIAINGGDTVIVRDCSAWYCGFGMVIGTYPNKRIFIRNFMGVACTSYAIAGGGSSGTFSDQVGREIDIEATAINCGTLSFWNGFNGAVGSTKGGFDITGNAQANIRFRGTAYGCGFAFESKITIDAIPTVQQAPLKDMDFEIFATVTYEPGSTQILILNEGGTQQTSYKRMILKPTVMWRGPTTWSAATYFEVGDSVNNAGNVYICAGTVNLVGGHSGTLGAPTGTGNKTTCYFDGNLYWAFINTNTSSTGVALRIDCVNNQVTDHILIDGMYTIGIASGVAINSGNSSDILFQQNNVTFRNAVMRGITRYGFQDAGNPYNTQTGEINNLVLDNCDIEGNAIACLAFGRTGNGTTTGDSKVSLHINGGRFVNREPTLSSASFRFDGGTTTVDIRGGAHFESNGGGPTFYASTNAVANVDCYDATINCNKTSGGGDGIQGVTGTVINWNNHGPVIITNGDNNRRAYSTTGTINWRGGTIRGIADANPQGLRAGVVGERLKLAAPTSTVSAYECTTAGTAAAAVWTAKS